MVTTPRSGSQIPCHSLKGRIHRSPSYSKLCFVLGTYEPSTGGAVVKYVRRRSGTGAAIAKKSQSSNTLAGAARRHPSGMLWCSALPHHPKRSPTIWVHAHEQHGECTATYVPDFELRLIQWRPGGCEWGEGPVSASRFYRHSASRPLATGRRALAAKFAWPRDAGKKGAFRWSRN